MHRTAAKIYFSFGSKKKATVGKSKGCLPVNLEQANDDAMKIT